MGAFLMSAGPVSVLAGLFSMHLHLEDNTVSRVIGETHEWEPDTTAIIRETLKPGQVFVDAGANIGYFTLLASKLVGDQGKVYAFEPWKANYDLLTKNIELNQCRNVVARREPLWNKSGLAMQIQGDGNPNKGDINVAPVTDEIAATMKGSDDLMTSTTLDDLFLPDQVDFVKVDCQSSDGEILRGAKRLFSESRKEMHLMVETPMGIPEAELGCALVRKTTDYNYYYIKKERPQA